MYIGRGGRRKKRFFRFRADDARPSAAVIFFSASLARRASKADVTTRIASCSSIRSIRRFMRSRADWRCGG